MTLLASVNYLRRLMREEEITAISPELDIQTQVGLLNDASDEILNSHRWSFLRRYDGYAFFPARYTDTGGLSITNGGTSCFLNQLGTGSWAASNTTEFTTNVRARLRVTADTSFSDTSILLNNINSTTPFAASLGIDSWPGDTFALGAGEFEVCTYEFVLPSTVRQVLAVWDQEGDLSPEFIDRPTEFDPWVIRPHDQFTDRPEIVMVGGTYTTTTIDSGSSTTGTGLVIWPPPSSDLLIQYSYLYKYAELSDGSDAWTGVPTEVVRLIEHVAFEHALDSNVEDDGARGRTEHAKNQRRLERLLGADMRDPNRRMVPDEIGNRRSRLDSPYRRWASRTITAP